MIIICTVIRILPPLFGPYGGHWIRGVVDNDGYDLSPTYSIKRDWTDVPSSEGSCHEEIYSCMSDLFDRFHLEIICMEMRGDVKKDKASIERHTLEEEGEKKKMSPSLMNDFQNTRLTFNEIYLITYTSLFQSR